MTEARHIRVTGLVQGVGFRPFVWRLARELELAGWVRNDAAGVEIAAEGETRQLDILIDRLRREAPPLARVEDVCAVSAPARGHGDFVIAASGGGAVTTAIGQDTGLCGDCLDELFKPADRRWRHPFITCTHCGPRYTLTRRLPYDRANTSLVEFPLCPDCKTEYTDPGNRRFHAETLCCPNCGPQLQLLNPAGGPLPGDAIVATLDLLQRGAIVAIKGLGGFHLVCDARNANVVARLRERKAREEKPFAVMAANAASFLPFANCDAAAQALLQAPARPVVLLPKAGIELAGIAPGIQWLGAMLPATPIQWLLFHEAAGRPAGTDWLRDPQSLLLVMTSANPGGEPLVTGNNEALQRLSGIADAFLLHDRDILLRCDDSVMRVSASGPAFLRRARGYTPCPIKLPLSGPSVLALGAALKNTLCITRGDEAFVSAHIGDLDNAATCTFLEETVEHLSGILDVRPEALACDLHPDFHSTRLAHALAERWNLPLIQVQHHHAHLAALAVEHGVSDTLIGCALDGVGLGSDGTPWGGELLSVDDDGSFARLGHLTCLPLPGGDRAAREPWRMAAAVLHRLGRGDEIALRYAAHPAAAQLNTLLERGINAPLTSSLGRVFDAAAALLGLCDNTSFEGQAAMLLEGCAARHSGALRIWGQSWHIEKNQLSLLPLLARLAEWDGSREEAAARFHLTLAHALVDWISALAPAARTVAFGGGCCLNAILTRHLSVLLEDSGRRGLFARQLPPNDGGISLGQAWVALQRIVQCGKR
ncbi:Carbamoyltransferase HypF2 [Georgfuchsia toluolica]|uniref:Carbamoyltransferase HypF n=1 Tax=Georgfuchsia toluolica TaxID=424218 RepID=A0A916MZM6_9PROT|nr:carbamoyltransferase HypF [Georgfuchsia toluolica]CAG4883088.1 Carbamoyltransferase HypF2 [Georgfuchsia toluolica]